MKNFSLLTKTYIFSTMVIGGYLLFWHLQYLSLEVSRLMMLLALCVAASMALIFKVEGSTNRSHYAISFVIYSFCLLQLGLPETLIVIFISNLAEWLWHRPLWYTAAFNCACYMTVTEFTELVYFAFNPSGNLQTWQSVAAIVFSMVAFTLLNHLMVGIIIWIARGENFAKSGIFDYLPLIIDLTMLVMGASLNLVWNYNPFAVVLFLIPLYLIYSTLRVPALERQTEQDAKTGLFNHKYFMEQLESELTRAERYDRPLSVIMGDLDLLRVINNTYGHLAGDEVLKDVAKILQESVRDYDVVARFGGEEFVVLMPETISPVAYERAEVIRKKIEETEFTISTSVIPIRATISLGVVGRERTKQTKEEIIHNADTAMYHSKLKGRNRTFVYNAGAYMDFIHKTEEDRVPMEEAAPGGLFATDQSLMLDPQPPDSSSYDTLNPTANYSAAYSTYQFKDTGDTSAPGEQSSAGRAIRGDNPAVPSAQLGEHAGINRLKLIILKIFSSIFHGKKD